MRQHVLKLDALRGLAAQPVAISHASALVFPPSAAMTAVGWSAHLAVIFFFVLSGYAIIGGLFEEYRSRGRIDLLDYSIRRVARIYPPYLLTIVIVLVYFSIHQEHGAYDTSALATLRSLVFCFFSTDAITLTPVWSLRIEVVLYAIAAITFAAYSSRGLPRAIFIAISATLTALMCFKLSFAVTGLVSFVAGGAIYRLGSFSTPTTESPFWKFLSPMGGWSYTLYLTHMPFILISMEATENLPPLFRVILAVLAANLASIVLSIFVERSKLFADALRSILPKRAVQSFR